MNLTEKTKNNITNAFKKHMYSNEIAVFEAEDTINEELEVVTNKGALKANFVCNAKNITKEMAKELYGLEVKNAIILSCEINSDIKPNDFVEYNNNIYIVKLAINYDLYMKVLIDEF